MSDKVKFLFLDKEMREMAERLGVDKQTPEESGQAVLKALEDPEQREFVLECLKLIENGDIQSLRKIWEGIIKKKKELGGKVFGAQNSEGEFMCLPCIDKLDVFQKYFDDDLICFFDLDNLKPGSFYQCDNCKEKFSLDD